MKKPLVILAISLMLCSCAPQREFVQFGHPGTFHPGHQHAGGESSTASDEYDSYELVDNGGIPNQGIAPMYSGGHQRGYGGYNNGGYPRAVDTYDQYGSHQSRIYPNTW